MSMQDAKKGVLFDSLPPVLQLQLKRFEYDFQRDAMVKVSEAAFGHGDPLKGLRLFVSASECLISSLFVFK